jgi:hypothetical protein
MNLARRAKREIENKTELDRAGSYGYSISELANFLDMFSCFKLLKATERQFFGILFINMFVNGHTFPVWLVFKPLRYISI